MDEILGTDKRKKVEDNFLADAKYGTVLCCDLCGNSETKLVDKEGNILQCKSCGLRFVSPRPTQQHISKNYDWSYQNCPGWEDVTPEAQLMYEKRLNFLEKFTKGGRILDVGAGRGEFLSKVRGTDKWQCFGTDTSQYAVDFTKKRFDIALSFGQLEDLPYPADFFDAITFWHVLEHCPYPSRAIGAAKRILKQDGSLFIAVPNDSWLGRRHFFKNAFKKAINRLPIKKKIKLKKMYPEIAEIGNVHLFYFTPRTLTKLLDKSGFRVKKYSVDYNYGRSTPKLERSYRFYWLFCRLTGINLSNTILIAAQKTKQLEYEKIQ